VSVMRFIVDTISGRRRGVAAATTRAALNAAAPFYGAAVALRNNLYGRGLLRVYAAPLPVVSVGNITTGGTGKTPIVQWLAGALGRRGISAAILIRGYKPGAAGSDEAELLAKSLTTAGPDSSPVRVIANADRVAAARQICRDRHPPDVLILDDGFQHRRLRRDFDLVLIDATRPFGFDRLLPRGLLREPASALHRADTILVTRCDQVDGGTLAGLQDQLQGIAPAVPRHMSEMAFAGWVGQTGDQAATPTDPALAVCGIGNAAAFETSARRAGAKVVGLIELDDHHDYRNADLQMFASAAARAGARSVVTTEKDWIKLGPLLESARQAAPPALPPILVLKIAARIDGEEELLDRIQHALSAKKGRTAEG
jgi:tetraacyldisaccharide 4'-kinase